MIARLGILGGGHLAGFVCEGLVASGWGGTLMASPHNRAKAEDFAERFGARIAADNQDLIGGSDAVLVAVRPPQAEAALAGLRWPEGRVLLSAMAGVKSAALEALAPGARVVRIMPISAARIGASPTPLYPDDPEVSALFSHVGTPIPMASEAMLEAASVNAAAYGWYFKLIDTMIAANIAAGLDEATAKRMSVETLAATCAVARSSEATSAEIIETLATPGGITAQGLGVLDEGSGFAAWRAAYDAVAARVRG